MALTGSENTLSALIQSQLATRVTAIYGQPPQSPNIVNLLADALAFSIIPHFVSNAEVLPGSFANGGGPVGGVGALI